MQVSDGCVVDALLDPQPIRFKAPKVVKDLRGLAPVLGRAGSLELRLATTKKDIRRAQRLRYKSFYVEGGAIPETRNLVSGRDECPFDEICDHLLVVDLDAAKAKDGIVGTYRLLRSDVASGHGGFYSQTEFELGPMLALHKSMRFLELGRACVHADFRSKRVIELLWRGIGFYVQHHRIDALIGCASLPGTDPDALAAPLSFLFHHAAAEGRWQVPAVPGRGVRMNRLGVEELDRRRVLTTLPPLVKAYVRAGGRFASEAVIDHQFRTTDLFTILPFATADARYMAHFGAGEMIRMPEPH